MQLYSLALQLEEVEVIKALMAKGLRYHQVILKIMLRDVKKEKKVNSIKSKKASFTNQSTIHISQKKRRRYLLMEQLMIEDRKRIRINILLMKMISQIGKVVVNKMKINKSHRKSLKRKLRVPHLILNAYLRILKLKNDEKSEN
jgi:hypothetical protein